MQCCNTLVLSWLANPRGLFLSIAQEASQAIRRGAQVLRPRSGSSAACCCLSVHTDPPTASASAPAAPSPTHAKGDAKNDSSAATAEGDQRLQIAVMIRCDVFRDCRARKKNSTPGPAEFFRVVNYAAAQHLADVPVALPDLTEVLAEVARTDLVSGGLGDSTATVS